MRRRGAGAGAGGGRRRGRGGGAVADAPTVVEVGAGRGTLARAVRAAGYGGRYMCVERSAVLRAAAAAAGFEVADSLPPGPFEGVVLANELLDNLPFRLLERAED